MTQLQTWAMDPFDIVWKNFMNSNSTFNTLQEKINYQVDIYETENGLRFELAVVGLTENDLSIQIEDNTLRIKHDKLEDNIPLEELQYLQEMAFELIAMCEQGDPKSAWVKLEEENLDSEQKVAIWTLLPSKVRSALKKAKEI